MQLKKSTLSKLLALVLEFIVKILLLLSTSAETTLDEDPLSIIKNFPDDNYFKFQVPKTFSTLDAKNKQKCHNNNNPCNNAQSNPSQNCLTGEFEDTDMKKDDSDNSKYLSNNSSNSWYDLCCQNYGNPAPRRLTSNNCSYLHDGYVIIDTEGSISPEKRNHLPKLTTYYLGLVSWIYVKNGVTISLVTHHITLPKKIPDAHFKQWQHSRFGVGTFKGHGVPFHQKGISIDNCLNLFYQFLHQNNYPPILAKGSNLEYRFTNNLGLQGSLISKQSTTYHPLVGLNTGRQSGIPIIDITPSCRKYDDVYPDEKHHNPMKELNFFNSEIKKLLKI